MSSTAFATRRWGEVAANLFSLFLGARHPARNSRSSSDGCRSTAPTVTSSSLTRSDKGAHAIMNASMTPGPTRLSDLGTLPAAGCMRRSRGCLSSRTVDATLDVNSFGEVGTALSRPAPLPRLRRAPQRGPAAARQPADPRLEARRRGRRPRNDPAVSQPRAAIPRRRRGVARAGRRALSHGRAGGRADHGCDRTIGAHPGDRLRLCPVAYPPDRDRLLRG